MPFGWWDLGAMLVFTIILIPIAISGPARITRAEGITLLVMYAAYITWSILREI
jgi:Ca2+/Na+ antiporter